MIKISQDHYVAESEIAELRLNEHRSAIYCITKSGNTYTIKTDGRESIYDKLDSLVVLLQPSRLS